MLSQVLTAAPASNKDLTISKELLLSAGADPSLVNSHGKTAVDVALDSHAAAKLLHPQVDLLQDTTSSSTSASTTTYHRLDQLRIALRDPLPPAGMIKHDVDDLEDIEKQYIYHK